MGKLVPTHENSNRGPSPLIWGVAPIEEVIFGRQDGVFAREEFDNCPTFASATSKDGHITYQDTGVTIKGFATELHVLEIAGADADNDEGWLQRGDNVASAIKIASSAGKRFWFECRFKIDTLADRALFCGFSEPGLAAANTLVDNTGALADKDVIGFHADTAAPSALDAVYRKAGQTAAVVQAAATTLVADTYVKAGMTFDPKDSNNDARFRYWINGAQVGEISQTALEAATFPDGEEMNFLFGIKAGEAVEKKAYLDWYQFLQLG